MEWISVVDKFPEKPGPYWVVWKGGQDDFNVIRMNWDSMNCW